MTAPIRPSEVSMIEIRQALQRIELNRRQAPKNNIGASTNPGLTDDETEGYSPGSLWYNAADGELLICADPTRDRAIWESVVTFNMPGSTASFFRVIISSEEPEGVLSGTLWWDTQP